MLLVTLTAMTSHFKSVDYKMRTLQLVSRTLSLSRSILAILEIRIFCRLIEFILPTSIFKSKSWKLAIKTSIHQNDRDSLMRSNGKYFQRVWQCRMLATLKHLLWFSRPSIPHRSNNLCLIETLEIRVAADFIRMQETWTGLARCRPFSREIKHNPTKRTV